MGNESIWPPADGPGFEPAIDMISIGAIIVSSYGSVMMKGLLSFLCVSVGGAIGWWLGSFVGFMTAVFLSVLGSGVGLYFALRLHHEYFE